MRLRSLLCLALMFSIILFCDLLNSVEAAPATQTQQSNLDKESQLEPHVNELSGINVLSDEQLKRLEDPDTPEEEKTELLRLMQLSLDKLLENLKGDMKDLHEDGPNPWDRDDL